MHFSMLKEDTGLHTVSMLCCKGTLSGFGFSVPCRLTWWPSGSWGTAEVCQLTVGVPKSSAGKHVPFQEKFSTANTHTSTHKHTNIQIHRYTDTHRQIHTRLVCLSLQHGVCNALEQGQCTKYSNSTLFGTADHTHAISACFVRSPMY